MSEPSASQEALVRYGIGEDLEQVSEEVRRVILFQACDEWFALPIEFVREVQPLESVTRVPTAPPDILGVVNIRGRVLTLFGLAACLDLSPGTRPETHVVVLDLGDPELRIGLAVQGMGGVCRVPCSALEPPPPRGKAPGGLEAIFETQGKVVGLLDPAKVFVRSLAECNIVMEPRTLEKSSRP